MDKSILTLIVVISAAAIVIVVLCLLTRFRSKNAMTNKSMKFNIVLQNHPEHAFYIANLISVWNTVERINTRLLAMFLNCRKEQAEAIFLTIRSNKAKLQILERLGTITVPLDSGRSDFLELFKKLGKQYGYRSKLAHAVFGVDGSGKLNVVKEGVDFRYDPNGARILKLDELKAEWAKAAENFNNLMKQHNLLLASLAESGHLDIDVIGDFA